MAIPLKSSYRFSINPTFKNPFYPELDKALVKFVCEHKRYREAKETLKKKK